MGGEEGDINCFELSLNLKYEITVYVLVPMVV